MSNRPNILIRYCITLVVDTAFYKVRGLRSCSVFERSWIDFRVISWLT